MVEPTVNFLEPHIYLMQYNRKIDGNADAELKLKRGMDVQFC